MEGTVRNPVIASTLTTLAAVVMAGSLYLTTRKRFAPAQPEAVAEEEGIS